MGSVSSARKIEARQRDDKSAGRPFNIHRHLALRKAQLKSKATLAERTFLRKLKAWGYKPHFQKGFIAGGVVYVADFYLPSPLKVVIEVDGPSHFTKDGIEKDMERDAYFKKRGFRVVHMTNGTALSINKEYFYFVVNQ